MKTITPQQWATLEFDSVVVISSQHQLNQLDKLVKKDISNWGSHHGFPFALYRTIINSDKDADITYSSMNFYEKHARDYYPHVQPVKITSKLLKTKEYSNGKN